MAMRYLFSIFFLFFINRATAQHCPWDCSGMLLIKTDATREEMMRLDLTVVDMNKNPIIEKQYSKNKNNDEPCRFLYYDDFLASRISQIKTDSWNKYDTAYHFAKEHYVVRINYCNNNKNELFVRYVDSSSTSGYKYIEIPYSRRIHLHDYNNEIRNRQTALLLQMLEPFILPISRKEFGLL